MRRPTRENVKAERKLGLSCMIQSSPSKTKRQWLKKMALPTVTIMVNSLSNQVSHDSFREQLASLQVMM